jgi:large subunit ribosomal protein L19
MSLTATHKEVVFGIGDKIKVSQRIHEKDKERIQVFEGIVIAFKNRAENKSFTVRKIGEARIGIERIFPLSSPTIEKIEVVKKGVVGVKRAKLYYVRGKAPREIEKIYSRTHRKTPLKE